MELRSARALEQAATLTLIDNWRGHATVPAAGLYPHQWSWDSAFIALGQQHLSPRRAAAELLSLLGGQWADGRVPHIVFNPAVPESAYFPGPAFWASHRVAGAAPAATSGVTQPPIHAVAALSLMNRMEDPQAFGERIYPLLRQQSGYLERRRVIPGTGLACILHPWESGLDNSPAWDAPLAAVPADGALFARYRRHDLAHANEGERPTDEDYARYIRLALAYRDSGYDDDWARENAEFVVLDPAFNSLWAWSELALAEIARRLGLDPEPHQATAARLAQALHTLLPSGEGLALALDLRTGRRQPERTVGGLLPLLLPDLAVDAVDSMVDTLAGPAFDAASPDTLGVPTYDRTSSKHDSRRYWRGPTWMNTTWLVATGLRTHGRTTLAAKLEDDLLRLGERAGLREYFDPRTGVGHGAHRFSWTAAIILHLLRS